VLNSLSIQETMLRILLANYVFYDAFSKQHTPSCIPVLLETSDVWLSSTKESSLYATKKKKLTGSAGLKIVANIAIAMGPAFLGSPRSFVLNLTLLYARVDIRICATSQKGGPIFYTCYKKILFAESKLNFSFCLGTCFWVEVNRTLWIFWSHLILNCSLSTQSFMGPCFSRLHTLFALFCQTYGLLQILNVALESLKRFVTKQCKN